MFAYRTAYLFGIEEYDNYAALPCVRGDIYGHPGHLGLMEVLNHCLGKQSFNRVEPLCGKCDTKKLIDSLKRAIETLQEQGRDDERTLLFIYFSGHGVSDEDESPEDQFLIAASDTEADQPKRGLRFTWLLKQLRNLKMAVVCCVDCCHGGTAIVGAQHYAQDKENLAIFASCAPNEESYFTEDHEQSRFTRFLIEALLGKEPFALELREVTTHSLASCFEKRFLRGIQRPTCWRGSVPLLLAHPRSPVPITTCLSPDQVDGAFRRSVEGRLQEYSDYPELNSDEFYVRSSCQRFVLQGISFEKTPDDPFMEPTMDSLVRWAGAADRPVLLLMGDTGTGKTTALRRFWYDQAKAWLDGRSRRIPFLLNLRLFGGVRMSETYGQVTRGRADIIASEDHAVRKFRAIFTDAIQNRETLPIFWHDFEGLCREGRLLLVLDGLDEMDIEGLRDAPAANLALLMRLLGSNGKIIVACRTHYLRSEYELADVLSRAVPRPATVALLVLNPFNQKQVSDYLRPRLSPDNLERWHRVSQTDTLGMLDLCLRPFLLCELVSHFEEVIEEDRIRPSKLLYRYLQTWLDRDRWRFDRFLNDFRDAIERDRARLDESTARDVPRSDLAHWADRVLAGFIEILAAYMWTANAVSISATNIPTIIRAHLPSAPDVFVAFFDYAIRTCSFLMRNADDVYTFIDHSVLEYFAMRKFRDDILNTEYPWDTSRDRAVRPVPRIPLELGRRRLSARMADTLADALRADAEGARRRLAEIIHTTAERVRASPQTLYFLGGNCLSVYARLNRGTVPSDTTQLDLRRKWINAALLEGCNLSKVDLSGALLDGADLQRAILRGATLYGARLYRCRLAGSDLQGVRIDGDQDAVVVASDAFDPCASAAPSEFREVFRLSNSKSAGARTFRRPEVDIRGMFLIPGGVFWMGSDSRMAQPYERPARPVHVDPVYLDIRPVTNREFAEFVAGNPEWRKDAVIDRFGIPYYLCYWQDDRPPPGKEDHPVVYVNWYAAAAYAEWVGKRLPTEAEWEFALRDGNHDRRWDYPYGPTADTGIEEWIRNQFETARDLPVEHRTLDVVKNVHVARKSRRYGLIDMNGNVNEWVQDWFADDYEYFAKLLAELRKSGRPHLEAYKGAEAGSRKVIRGGSYLFEYDIHWTPFATFYRRPLPPVNTNQDCGFRCALGAGEYADLLGAS